MKTILRILIVIMLTICMFEYSDAGTPERKKSCKYKIKVAKKTIKAKKHIKYPIKRIRL